MKNLLFCGWLMLTLWIATACQAAPPPIPIFDRATVAQLLEGIDQKHSLTLLKSAYFARRVAHPLPKAEGFEMVEEALKAQTVGEKKWLLLQILRGYAAFRVPRRGNKGFEAYGALFENLQALDTPEKQRMARTVVRDWVFTSVSSDMTRSRVGSSRLLKDLLGDAWKLYLRVPESEPARPYEAQWRKAIEGLRIEPEILAATSEVLATPQQLENSDGLRLAIQLSARVEPKTALPWLEQMEAKVTDKEKLGAISAARAQLFKQTERRDEAIVAAQKGVELMGNGYTLLLELLDAKKDEAAIANVVSQLQRPNAREAEVVATANQLIRLKREDDAQKLLESYLTIERPRTDDFEIQARLLVGTSLLKQKQKDGALRVLRPGAQLKPTSGVARFYFEALKSLLNQLQPNG